MFARTLTAFALICLATISAAQTNINLGGISTDPSAPIEVSADSLSVDQDTGKAIFNGNVVVGQGDLRLAAGNVEIVYGSEAGQIDRLQASGKVTFVTAKRNLCGPHGN